MWAHLKNLQKLPESFHVFFIRNVKKLLNVSLQVLSTFLDCILQSIFLQNFLLKTLTNLSAIQYASLKYASSPSKYTMSSFARTIDLMYTSNSLFIMALLSTRIYETSSASVIPSATLLIESNAVPILVLQTFTVSAMEAIGKTFLSICAKLSVICVIFDWSLVLSNVF